MPLPIRSIAIALLLVLMCVSLPAVTSSQVAAAPACDSVAPERGTLSPEPPSALADGWPVASLEDEGIDAAQIEAVTRRLLTEPRFEQVLSMLIVRHGRLVHEAYSPYCQRNSLHVLASVTKSISSTLIGIAIDRGHIESVDARVIDLLPEYADATTDERFGDIRLRHLMTMSSGLRWLEHGSSYNDEVNSEHIMVDTDDWIRYVVSRPVRTEPGSTFLYNTGGVHTLGAIVKSQTGMHLDEFAEQHLLHPLGIYAYQWNRDSTGHPCAGGTDGGIGLRTRDLAKIGWLFMRDGVWRGHRIVSSEWVKRATSNQIARGAGSRHYGFNWFTGDSRTIAGQRHPITASYGYGGQNLILVPDLDLMVIFTCELTDEPSHVNELIDATFAAVRPQGK